MQDVASMKAEKDGFMMLRPPEQQNICPQKNEDWKGVKNAVYAN